MKLLKRIVFAIKYDIDRDFIVYSIPDQTAIQFTDYDEAHAFSLNQIQYKPKVLVSVEKV